MNLKKELLKILEGVKSSSYSKKLSKYPELKSNLILSTSFLGENAKLNERIFVCLNDISSPVLCKECSSKCSFISFTKGYRLFCSSKCSKSSKSTLEKRKSTMIEKYGVDNSMKNYEIKEKYKDSMEEKHGVSTPLKSDKIKAKQKKTNLDRYGVNNVSQVKEIKEKRELTMLHKFGFKTNLSTEEFKKDYKSKMLLKYGVENPLKSIEFKNKMKESNLLKYGVPYYSQSEKFREHAYMSFLNKLDIYLKEFCLIREFSNDTYKGSYIITEKGVKKPNLYSFKCLKCNHSFKSSLVDGRYPSSCPKCNPIKNGISSYENELAEFLDNHNIKYIRNSRNVIKPFELDFYLPDYNFAIELNGLYYHSSSFLNRESIKNVEIYNENNIAPNKGKNFHLLKTKLCIKEDIFLFHINENEWLFKKDLVKSMILNRVHKNTMKFNARDCNIKEVSKNEKDIFLEENHIQGKCVSSFNLGLFYEDKLISLMTFSKSRFSRDENEYELIRFCNKKGCSIRGGASKLLKYFMKRVKIGNLISFADKRYSDGLLYETIGFNKVHETSPQYKYFKNLNVYNRMFFRKKTIEKMYYDYKNNNINSINFGLIKKYNELFSEEENMFLNGFDKIYDCGMIKYTKKIEI